MKALSLACVISGILLQNLCASAMAAQTAQYTQIYLPNPLEANAAAEQVSIASTTNKNQLRTFVLSSTQTQRDNKEKKRTVTENIQYPTVHTNSIFFDALYSMAIDDLRLDSVQAIRDDSYNNGDAIACKCFETGEKWNYVWTRDLAYSVNLSLAQFDTQRSINSLFFKTSNFRDQVTPPTQLPKSTLQIVQDTGSGGSWPVSTDRVTWALGATKVLQNLSGAARDEFATKTLKVLIGTIEADRLAVFDEYAGLYGGEQSYLDWRTQTYAPWITNNLSRMAQSKALSTNVLHYQALHLAAELAREKNNSALAEKYSNWADSLKQKINEKFWLNDVNLYSTMTTSAEDSAAVYKYDSLGNSLAILLGVASPEQAQKIVATYPTTPTGVPVYYPQMPNVYVYHNRALWPFVTAYALNAAVKVNNNKVADNAIESLVRSAALNLSNMENLEWLTGKPYYDDGPAISSRRQLWSVAAYLNMVSQTIFGINIQQNNLTVSPFLTPASVALLGKGKEASLDNLFVGEKKVSVYLQLPQTTIGEDGVYSIANILLNGKSVTGAITDAMLGDNNDISVSFGPLIKSTATITLAQNVNPLSHDDAKVFSPEAPTNVKILQEQNHFAFRFDAQTNANKEALVFNIYRDGKLIATKLTDKYWRDSQVADNNLRHCFSVESEFVSSGNKSLHSEPVCNMGKSLQTIAVTDKRARSNIQPTRDNHYAQPVLLEWGAPQDTFSVNRIKIKEPGTYAIQVHYNNRQHTIDSGVTNSAKTISISNPKKSWTRNGVVQMPNVQDIGENSLITSYPINTSTEFNVELAKGEYQLELSDFFNMSYLAANQTYKGKGGLTGAINKTSIAGISLVRIE